MVLDVQSVKNAKQVKDGLYVYAVENVEKATGMRRQMLRDQLWYTDVPAVYDLEQKLFIEIVEGRFQLMQRHMETVAALMQSE